MTGDCGHGWGYHEYATGPCTKCEEERMSDAFDALREERMNIRIEKLEQEVKAHYEEYLDREHQINDIRAELSRVIELLRPFGCTRHWSSSVRGLYMGDSNDINEACKYFGERPWWSTGR